MVQYNKENAAIPVIHTGEAILADILQIWTL